MNPLFQKYIKRFINKAQGAVEFALILPVLLLLIVGIFAMGHLFFVYIMTSSAAREAVRYGMASGQTPSGVTRYLDCEGMRAAATRVGGAVGVQTSANVTIAYDHGPGTNPYATCPTNGNFPAGSEPTVNQGDRVVVTVQITYRPYLPLVTLPSFPVRSMAARTVVKSISVGEAPPSYDPPPSPGEPPPEGQDPLTCEGVGSISRQVWLNIMGDQVSHLTSAPAYPDAPTYQDSLSSFDMPQSYPNINNYGTRIRGYVCPPYTGNYTFYLSSNNAGVLYLSSSQDPGSKSAIVTINDWTYYQEWRSSASIALTGGQLYYIEVLHKEDVELDYVSVGWSGPGFEEITVIAGQYLKPFGP